MNETTIASPPSVPAPDPQPPAEPRGVLGDTVGHAPANVEASFDITGAARQGQNQVTILCERTFLNELGTGGLLGPVVVYRDKD